MTEEQVLRFVLRETVEYPLGLYEVLWGMNDEFPAVDDARRAEAGRAAVSALLARGWIALYLQPWQPEGSGGDFFDPIPTAEWESVLSIDENWSAPRFNTYVAVGATTKGRAAYREMVKTG